MRRRAVTSRIELATSRPPSVRIGLRLISTENSVPSLRRAVRSLDILRAAEAACSEVIPHCGVRRPSSHCRTVRRSRGEKDGGVLDGQKSSPGGGSGGARGGQHQRLSSLSGADQRLEAGGGANPRAIATGRRAAATGVACWMLCPSHPRTTNTSSRILGYASRRRRATSQMRWRRAGRRPDRWSVTAANRWLVES